MPSPIPTDSEFLGLWLKPGLFQKRPQELVSALLLRSTCREGNQLQTGTDASAAPTSGPGAGCGAGHPPREHEGTRPATQGDSGRGRHSARTAQRLGFGPARGAENLKNATMRHKHLKWSPRGIRARGRPAPPAPWLQGPRRTEVAFRALHRTGKEGNCGNSPCKGEARADVEEVGAPPSVLPPQYVGRGATRAPKPSFRPRLELTIVSGSAGGRDPRPRADTAFPRTPGYSGNRAPPTTGRAAPPPPRPFVPNGWDGLKLRPLGRPRPSTATPGAAERRAGLSGVIT